MSRSTIILPDWAIRALLSGQKTRHTEVGRPQPVFRYGACWYPGPMARNRLSYGCERHLRRGFIIDFPGGYKASTRLAVLETWSPIERDSDSVDGIRYRSDDAFVPIENTREAAERWIVAANNDHSGGWRPPRQMPLWASRLTVEVNGLELRRLHEITDTEAYAEGTGIGRIQHCRSPSLGPTLDAFANQWDAEHKPGLRWTDDPWCPVIHWQILGGKEV